MYQKVIKSRFDDVEGEDEVYAAMQKIRYEGHIWDMFTTIMMHNDGAQFTGVALEH